jgi:hypothetical protein
MNNNLQRLYAINLRAALIFCGVMLAYFVLYSLSIIQVDSKYSLLAILVIFVVFLPINLLLKSKNKNHKLKLPDFLPKKFLRILPTTALIIFFVILIYGSLLYPGAPIKPDGSFFTDKLGAIYTYEQFRVFQKWEVAYIVSWSIAALLGIVYLPFFDGTSRKWRF